MDEEQARVQEEAEAFERERIRSETIQNRVCSDHCMDMRSGHERLRRVHHAQVYNASVKKIVGVWRSYLKQKDAAPAGKKKGK